MALQGGILMTVLNCLSVPQVYNFSHLTEVKTGVTLATVHRSLLVSLQVILLFIWKWHLNTALLVGEYAMNDAQFISVTVLISCKPVKHCKHKYHVFYMTYLVAVYTTEEGAKIGR
jgi:hypothetical protein